MAGAPARVVRRWTPAEGRQPPLRTPAPVPIPDGITPGQLRELSKLDDEAVARLAALDEDPQRAPGRLAEPAAEG
ncbi:acyltransferase [Streptomyces violaceorubidus]